MVWEWTGDNPTSLTINGELQSGTWNSKKHPWEFTADIDESNYPPRSASITYHGDSGNLSLASCEKGEQAHAAPRPRRRPRRAHADTRRRRPSPHRRPTPTPTPAPTPTPTPTADSEPLATPLVYEWRHNGFPNATCIAGSTSMQWIWTGDNPTSLTINGQRQTGEWAQGGPKQPAWHFMVAIDATNFRRRPPRLRTAARRAR